MEDKSETINKHDKNARIKRHRVVIGAPYTYALPPPPVIDQVFPSDRQIAVITERIKLFIKNNKPGIMYGCNRQGTDGPE